jgi:transposase InsO family protein
MKLWPVQLQQILRQRMTATLVCDAPHMALFNRKRPRGVIVHGDRGSQYCWLEHRALLEAHGLIGA